MLLGGILLAAEAVRAAIGKGYETLMGRPADPRKVEAGTEVLIFA